jgi:hypothetical protein
MGVELLKLNISDTAAMGARVVSQLNDTATLINARIASINNGSTSGLATKLNIADTAAMGVRVTSQLNDTATLINARIASINNGSTSGLATKLNISDTAGMGLRVTSQLNDTATLINARIAAEQLRAVTGEDLRVKYSDTAAMGVRVVSQLNDTSTLINARIASLGTGSAADVAAEKTRAIGVELLKLNIADTAAMGVRVVSQLNDTATLINARIASINNGSITGLATKLNIADTAAMGVRVTSQLNDTATLINARIASIGTGSSADVLAEKNRAMGVELLKANILSPDFTGVPTAPTALPGTTTTQIATTEFVTSSVATATPDASVSVKGKVQLAGDLGGSAALPTVVTVGGSTSSDINIATLAANAATDLNTASKIVARDASGNFTATTITAALSGNATTATNLQPGGTAGQVLTSNGGTNAPTWSSSSVKSFAIKTGNYTVGDADYTVLMNATSTNLTVTLPSPSGTNSGRIIIVGKADETANTLTFSPAINLTVSTTITSLNFATTYTLQSDGSNWWVVYKN